MACAIKLALTWSMMHSLDTVIYSKILPCVSDASLVKKTSDKRGSDKHLKLPTLERLRTALYLKRNIKENSFCIDISGTGEEQKRDV